MDKQKIIEELASYPAGTVFRIEWDRNNGELTANYLFFGFEEGKPTLKKYENGRTLKEYKTDAVFDMLNPSLFIKGISIVGALSVKSLETLFNPEP